MSPSDRPSSGHEELALKVRASSRVATALITILLSTAGAGGATYSLGSADRERAEIDRRLAEQAAEAAETEQAVLRARICTLERELTAEVSARVSLSAADAEPTRSRKAQAAALAVKHFDAMAEDWACPATAADREKRTDRPLWKRAQNAMPATVPGR